MLNGMNALLKSDLRSIRRDPLLALMCLAPVLLGTVLGLLLPYADQLLEEYVNFDLSPHFPFIGALFLLLPPLLAGSIFGLLFIEERDARVPDALSVTPLGRRGFYLFRFLLTLGWAFLFNLLFIAVNVLVAGPLLFPAAALSRPAVLMVLLAAALSTTPADSRL